MTPVTARSFVAGVGLVLLVGASGQVGQAQQSNAAAAASTRALLDEYCVACHNDRSRQAGLTLESVDLTQVGRLTDEHRPHQQIQGHSPSVRTLVRFYR